jgi:hypothetical protein
MPSMVVTTRRPTALTGSMHERTGWPSRCTVQAPQLRNATTELRTRQAK